MITDKAYKKAAETLKCPVAAIKAVAQVEASGSGFLPDGQPKILFEAHHFSELTGGKYDKSHPNISSPKWNRSLYKGGAREHERLAEAVKLDREAALQSASWGKFQIMGSNYDACGYSSVQAFINAMYKDEDAHLEAFVNFVKHERMDQFLRAKDWERFARRYNGPGYRANNYHEKLANAYAAEIRNAA